MKLSTEKQPLCFLNSSFLPKFDLTHSHVNPHGNLNFPCRFWFLTFHRKFLIREPEKQKCRTLPQIAKRDKSKQEHIPYKSAISMCMFFYFCKITISESSTEIVYPIIIVNTLFLFTSRGGPQAPAGPTLWGPPRLVTKNSIHAF